MEAAGEICAASWLLMHAQACIDVLGSCIRQGHCVYQRIGPMKLWGRRLNK